MQINWIILYLSMTSDATSGSRQLTEQDNELIMQMVSMGFSPELAHEAVSRSPPDSLEQAVEYCFNHPNPSTSSSSAQAADETTAATSSVAPSTITTAIIPTTTTLEETASMSSSTNEPARPVIEISSLDLQNRIHQSLTNMQHTIDSLEAASSSSTSKKEEKQQQTQDVKMDDQTLEDTVEQIHQLDKVILDKFANNMLPGLTKILDNVPDTVYRVCDLVVVVAKKYGDQWRDNSLLYILNETCDLIKQVCDIYKEAAANKSAKLGGISQMFRITLRNFLCGRTLISFNFNLREISRSFYSFRTMFFVS